MNNVQKSKALNNIECPYPEPFLLLTDGLYIRDFSHREDEYRFISNFLPIIDSVIEFSDHVEKRLRYFPDAFSADKAADIMGYAKSTVLAYIQQKRIFAVQISGKYIVPKSALVEFLVDDFAFEIVHKSTWHMNTILLFVEKE